MNANLNNYIKANFADYKSDFFSAFFVRCMSMAQRDGFLGFFSPYVWMFIQSYEKMRYKMYDDCTIETLIQFEYSAFEEATVPVCTFVFHNSPVKGKKGCYFRLTDFRGGMEVQRQKTLEAISDHNCGFYFEQTTNNFAKIPGAPVAYWVSEAFLKAFNAPKMVDIAKPRQGLATGDNNRFVRFWFECNQDHIKYNASSIQEAYASGRRWFPYNKGGEYRKWYGNNDFIVNWENDGYEIRNFVDSKGKLRSRPQNTDAYFRESVTWSKISSGSIAFRYKPVGHIFDVAGTSIFASREIIDYIHGLCNSSVALKIFNAISPTLNYEVGHICSLPVRINNEYKPEADMLVQQNVIISRTDWDSFETSWDFQIHPFVRYAHEQSMLRISDCFRAWQQECENRFQTLKHNEEELNRIFIDIYGLQDELTPDVEDKDVTVRRADLSRDIRSFISYAVGCMFGRYSLDVPGLAHAGGTWDAAKYTTFLPDRDGILPICDDEYFEDDIMGLFIRWVKAVYGKHTLEENLQFIADALGGRGSAREVIRGYFLNNFYADHLKIYQKRPIYWLFDSGRNNGFKCLIYMHRYQPDTIARIRTDYIHEQQSRYRTAMDDVGQRMNGASTSERVKLGKRLSALQAQAEELRLYEEKMHHLADQMIAIDLDDGVKVNYAKFQDVLAKIR